MNILVVEDYKKINDLLATFCRQEGYVVTQVLSAEEALTVFQSQAIDLVILDLMLPNMQGETFIKRLRDISDVYIMVISAKVNVAQKIDAIALGADDYLTKPFSIDEVMVRLRNVAKRLKINTPPSVSFAHGSLVIHPLSRQLFIHQKEVILTKHEYDILWYLINHRFQAFSREEIIEACFEESEAFDRVIDQFIKNIRKKIDIQRETSWIKTHYGIGYQFIGEPDA